MKEIDARGLTCPAPVVMAKSEMDAGESIIAVRVDNDAAVQNLTRLGESRAYRVLTRPDGDCTVVTLSNVGATPKPPAFSSVSPARPAAGADTPLDGGKAPKPPWALLITGEQLGRGSEELGDTLMSMLFYTLAQEEDTPAHILFLNGGVKLPTEHDEGTGDPEFRVAEQ